MKSSHCPACNVVADNVLGVGQIKFNIGLDSAAFVVTDVLLITNFPYITLILLKENSVSLPSLPFIHKRNPPSGCLRA